VPVRGKILLSFFLFTGLFGKNCLENETVRLHFEKNQTEAAPRFRMYGGLFKTLG